VGRFIMSSHTGPFAPGGGRIQTIVAGEDSWGE